MAHAKVITASPYKRKLEENLEKVEAKKRRRENRLAKKISGTGKSTTVTRKRGRTRVLTDTPQKLLIEKEAAERKTAKASKTGPRSQRNEKKEKKEVKPKNKKKNKKDYEESEDEETFCLVCTEPYSNSRAREKWVQCTACHMWAHEACTDGSCSYICHNCDSDDDSF